MTAGHWVFAAGYAAVLAAIPLSAKLFHRRERRLMQALDTEWERTREDHPPEV